MGMGGTQEIAMAGVKHSTDTRPGFVDHLKATLENTNGLQHQAKTAMEELATGRNGNIHETLLSMSKAETSFKMVMQVRNKVLNAYQEVMRMQM
ncbi:MAG: flagellar hook-basal body complex protein FliE, partial [Deltaproteobacteria bacterium]|jgi:flagellar hook-basal body complex protein FliE|nr:flagellar hook-basal body complex protein FliE [Deltaproteobacteria bacterium]